MSCAATSSMIDNRAYKRINMVAARRRANAGIQDPQSESILFRTRCQKTEFRTYGDVGNGRRRKEEGTCKQLKIGRDWAST